MGIPNLLPFPMQPNVRLLFRWTHSLLKKRPTKAASTLTALPLPPKAPLAAQQGSEAGIIRAGFVLHLSQVQSLLHSLGSFAGCWQSFFLCTFTSRLRSAPNCTEQRKAFSAINNEETSSLPQQSLKCFESMGLEDNSSDIWYWERGGTPPPPGAISQKHVPRGFTLLYGRDTKSPIEASTDKPNRSSPARSCSFGDISDNCHGKKQSRQREQRARLQRMLHCPK